MPQRSGLRSERVVSGESVENMCSRRTKKSDGGHGAKSKKKKYGASSLCC